MSAMHCRLRRWAPGILGLVTALTLCGCATPRTRIERHPEMFAASPADAQDRIRRGEIDLGFTRDMVYLALGRPDRVYSRTTPEGSREIWAYTRVVGEPASIVAPYGRWRPGDRPYWWRPVWPVDAYAEAEVLRVEFRDGAVSAIEQLTPQ